MSITSLSFAFIQYTGTVAMAEPKAPAPTPASVPKAAPEESCRHGGCDSPRKSPLMRVLNDALAEMVRTAQPSASGTPATTTTAPGATAAAGSGAPAQDAKAPEAAKSDTTDLEHALMDFARALMQALRSAGRQGEREDGGECDHHHRHHGRHQWGDPAQRVDMLGRSFDMTAPIGTAPAASPNSKCAAQPVAQDAAVSTTRDGAAPVAGETAMTATSAPQATTVYAATVSIQHEDAPSRLGGFQQRLLDAFGALQQAAGRPAAQEHNSLKEQLAAFLQALAQRLRGDDTVSADATPGALLSTTA
jgi:hypothetical protein